MNWNFFAAKEKVSRVLTCSMTKKDIILVKGDWGLGTGDWGLVFEVKQLGLEDTCLCSSGVGKP
jgi:hypothetical protein